MFRAFRVSGGVPQDRVDLVSDFALVPVFYSHVNEMTFCLRVRSLVPRKFLQHFAREDIQNLAA
jgi:hypothetical protein